MTLHVVRHSTDDELTLEPDGTATACKAVLSGFDSHRRLLGRGGSSAVDRAIFKQALTQPGQRRASLVQSFLMRVPRLDCDEGWVSKRVVSSVAEHQTMDLAVAGSTPVPTAVNTARARKRIQGPRETVVQMVCRWSCN